MAKDKSKQEPDVEDILASIREIIGEDDSESTPPVKKKATPAKKTKPKAVPVEKGAKSEKPEAKPAPPKKMPDLKEEQSEAEEVLVLTEVAPPEELEGVPETEPAPESEDLPPELAAEVQKEALEEVRALGIESSPEIDAAMEDLVRSMLKEMLKDYLDQHMADIVKKVAAEEILKMKKKS